ncbi:MAG: hypothetical protein DHS20C21_01330 [Gemmatimonadota bacterium]|nr:MAG: hypothetical protein DHS20C21_01330 [Gemmatimonadota bacterium]
MTAAITITEIPVDQLEANPWNPNKMSDETFAKLKAYVEREGLVEPLVVRAVKGRDKHQLLGGFHRWTIAKELGYDTVPCVVLRLSDRRAKILTINLNEMKGQAAPHLMADLVHDLSHDLSLDDLATQLPYDLADLRDLTDLLKIPDGLDLQLAEEASEAERDRMKVLSFPLSPDQMETVQGALDDAKEKIESPSRSAALTHVARTYRERGER